MSTTSTRVAAPVLEVFASIQGEGKYVGEPQTFLRLAGCPLRCRWCDTPGSWTVGAEPRARVAAVDGARREDGWASPFQAAIWVAETEPGEPRTLSITGGEPLLWPAFLRALRPMVAPRRVHLETAGAHPEALARVLDVVDHVSLDLKPPADMGAPVELPRGSAAGPDAARPIDEPAPGTAEDWTLARRRCLQLVREHDACAKVVVSAGRDAYEYEELFVDVARHAPDLPLHLAPATPVAGVRRPDAALLDDVVERARDLDLAVRVLPQVHRQLGLP